MSRQRARLHLAAIVLGSVLLALPEFVAYAVTYYFGPLAVLWALVYAVRWHERANEVEGENWWLRGQLEKQHQEEPLPVNDPDSDFGDLELADWHKINPPLADGVRSPKIPGQRDRRGGSS